MHVVDAKYKFKFHHPDFRRRILVEHDTEMLPPFTLPPYKKYSVNDRGSALWKEEIRHAPDITMQNYHLRP